jgi:hypothetical protein
MAKEGNFRVTVNAAKLFALRMQLSDQSLAFQNRLLSNGGIIFPSLRHDIRTAALPAGGQNLDWIPFSGAIPSRIYFFQCVQSAYNGKIEKNPFHFRRHGLQTFQVMVNGRSLPSNVAFVASNDEVLPYLSQLGLNGEPAIDPLAFIFGCMIITVDLTKTLSAGCNYDDEPTNGSLRLKATYKEGVKEALTVFCMGEFRANLLIDKDRNPSWI